MAAYPTKHPNSENRRSEDFPHDPSQWKAKIPNRVLKDHVLRLTWESSNGKAQDNFSKSLMSLFQNKKIASAIPSFSSLHHFHCCRTKEQCRDDFLGGEHCQSLPPVHSS